MDNKNVIIVGGGLAGLTAGIHLSRSGIKVTVIEKQGYPRHKVCGEYISNEVLPYLNWLDINPMQLQPAIIKKANFSTIDGKSVYCDLPLGGFGISRYVFDEFLYKHAISNGCEVIIDTVTDCSFKDDKFQVTLSSDVLLEADVVIGAHGKRSVIDIKLERKFIQKKSPWLAVKGHYKGEFPDDLVGLHNFNGGYCGISKVENNIINICYLADFKSFMKYRNVADYQREVVCQNPILKNVFENFSAIFDDPLTISQISFEKKRPVEKHIIMAGDTAGLIHPLCGNGMTMAIHGGKLAAEATEKFFAGELQSRTHFEKNYEENWNSMFSSRLKTGRLLASALQQKTISVFLLRAFHYFPFLLPQIIKMTHGKPLNIAA